MLFPNITGIAIGTHRGLTNQPNNLGHPPNTIASFTTTNQHHANYIECDCIMTLDNKIVLFHDKTITLATVDGIRKIRWKIISGKCRRYWKRGLHLSVSHWLTSKGVLPAREEDECWLQHQVCIPERLEEV